MNRIYLVFLLAILTSLTSCKQAEQLEEENLEGASGSVVTKNGNPIIKNLLPSGTLPNSTNTVTLQIETDEQATCKYALSNVSFYGMTESLDTIDGLNHTKEVSTNEVKTYTFYVSCQDLDGALVLGVNKIEFTIDSSSIDTIAPTVFNAGPTSTLADGTSQVNIYASTNENSTCRYSNNLEHDWEDMAQMSTTGFNVHVQNITGLSNGNTYNYYFICEDPSGNRSDKRGIAFSVSVFILQDGATLYANNCEYCHGAIPFSEKMGATAQRIQNGINGVGSMRALENLRDEEIANIVDVLAE